MIRWMPAIALAVLSTTAAQPARARADDWRFCLAVDLDARRTYLSDVFEDDTNKAALESWFAKVVAGRDEARTVVQCPVAMDRDVALESRDDAAEFNRRFGFVVESVTAEAPPPRARADQTAGADP